LVSESFNSDDKRLADKIMNADSELLSENEKKSKLLQLVYEYLDFMPERERNSIQEELESALARELKKHEFLEYTIINKIGIQKGKIDVLANGVVQGRILNQFSMDEHDQVFRIATTSTRNYRLQKEDASLNPAGLAAETKADEDEAIAPESTARIMIAPPIQRINEPSSNVFALDKDLKVVGSITGIAPSESIYSTRFVRDRLYMVTFRQVDPFFVFDLSDAKNLKALGELKIPGYSRYLHPYDESTIIGIGREASATGQVRGLKISLFDVRDVSKPKEVAKFTTPSSHANSIVEYEHKAFLFSKEKELLVIPAYSYSYDNWDPSGKRGGSGSFNGAMIFKVSKDNISLRGIVDHSQGTAYYGPAVERSLYINELLFTKSVGLLRINELSDLSSVKNLELSGFKSPYPIY
jgi:inhibitor of cysteine peptidase